MAQTKSVLRSGYVLSCDFNSPESDEKDYNAFVLVYRSRDGRLKWLRTWHGVKAMPPWWVIALVNLGIIGGIHERAK